VPILTLSYSHVTDVKPVNFQISQCGNATYGLDDRALCVKVKMVSACVSAWRERLNMVAQTARHDSDMQQHIGNDHGDEGPANYSDLRQFECRSIARDHPSRRDSIDTGDGLVSQSRDDQ
jgi:hypothetical protein